MVGVNELINYQAPDLVGIAQTVRRNQLYDAQNARADQEMALRQNQFASEQAQQARENSLQDQVVGQQMQDREAQHLHALASQLSANVDNPSVYSQLAAQVAQDPIFIKHGGNPSFLQPDHIKAWAAQMGGNAGAVAPQRVLTERRPDGSILQTQPDTGVITEAVREPPPKFQPIQTTDEMGMPKTQIFDTHTGRIMPAQGGAAAPQAQATPSAPLSGDAYLATQPSARASQIKALADGRLQFPSGFALKTPYWQSMLSAVAQYDPSFDAINYNARSTTRNKFSNGPESKTINNLNTAIGHAGRLYDQVSGTASHGGFPFATTVNAAQNWWNTHSGDPGVPLFKDTAGKLAQELTAVYRGSGGAERDVVRGLESLDPNASEETKRAILGNAVDLLQSKLEALGTQYSNGMGKSTDPFSLLNPEARKTFQKLQGGDQQAAGPSSGPVRVSTPQEAMALPPGTVFVTPDGRTKVR